MPPSVLNAKLLSIIVLPCILDSNRESFITSASKPYLLLLQHYFKSILCLLVTIEGYS